jgi:hypothetical protein
MKSAGTRLAGVVTATLLTGTAWLACPAFAVARDTMPLTLTNAQMDTVTAGVAAGVDLDASATGTTAETSTKGAVQVGNAVVWRVDVSPTNGITPVSDSAAEIVFGGGEAAAQGADPNCTARIALIGDFAYLNQTATVTTTPISATCMCAALAISFTPR